MALTTPEEAPPKIGRTARYAARAILIIGAGFIVVGLSLLLLFQLNGPGLPVTIWGALLVVVYGFFEPEAIRTLAGQGQVRAGSRALVLVLLVVAAVILLNVFVRDRLADKQLDLTKNRVNSLAPQTVDIVKRIDKPLTITLWAQTAVSENQTAFDLLQRYRAINGKITIHNYTTLERPQLAQQQKIQQVGSAVFEISGHPSEVATDLTEQGIDTTLLRISSGRSPKAYFLSGHGELNPVTPSQVGTSVTLLGTALKNQGFQIAQLNLSAGGSAGNAGLGATPNPEASPSGEASPAASPSPSPSPLPGSTPGVVSSETIPADADELLILDPRADLGEHEIKAINAYLDNGGHILVSLPPLSKSNVNEVIKRFGLSFGGGIVIDREQQANGYQPGVLQITKYGSSPVTRGLENLPAVMLETPITGKAASGYSMTPAVSTSNGSCQKTDVSGPLTCGDSDVRGALNLVVTVEQTGLKEGKKPARAVIMGGSSFASDVFAASQQASPPGNQPLMVNAANWLAGQDKVINVPPRTATAANIFLTDPQKQLVALGYPLLLPLLMLGLGVNAYLRRR